MAFSYLITFFPSYGTQSVGFYHITVDYFLYDRNILLNWITSFSLSFCIWFSLLILGTPLTLWSNFCWFSCRKVLFRIFEKFLQKKSPREFNFIKADIEKWNFESLKLVFWKFTKIVIGSGSFPWSFPNVF